MTRQGCPFCGHIHIDIVIRGRKSYAKCGKCRARGPEVDVSKLDHPDPQCEVSARWDERRPS